MNLNTVNPKTASLLECLNTTIAANVALNGIKEEEVCDAIRLLYMTMLHSYIVDRQEARDIVLKQGQDALHEYLSPLNHRLNEHLEAFEKELLDKPF